MKKLFLTLFLFLCLFSFSQKENNILNIKFEYRVSIVPTSKVKIVIYENYSESNSYNMFVNYYEGYEEKNKTINISEKDFKKITKSLYKIKGSCLINHFSDGLDGATTKIEFGNLANTITYELWGITKNENNTSKNFIKSVQIILDLANVKIDDFK